MHRVLRNIAAGLAVTTGLFSASADATVVIGGTRIIYPAQEKEVTVKLNNEGKLPALVQVWLDDGDEKSTPDTAKVPFTLAPPIFRMDAGKGQAVRLMYTNEPLPEDKESLYWLNVLEVPPKADAQGRSMLQFAFRTRIKLLFRPAKLAEGVEQAPDKLTWKLVSPGAGKELALQVSNPTPYYVNFAKVGIAVGEKAMGDEGGGMVAPGQIATFPLKGVTHIPAGEIKADFSVITDFGALNNKQAPVSH